MQATCALAEVQAVALGACDSPALQGPGEDITAVLSRDSAGNVLAQQS